MAEKAGYTAIPFEDSQVPSERELPPYSEKPRLAGPQTILIDSSSHECCYQHCHQRKKAWRKVLFALLIVFLGGRFLLAGLTFFMFNDFDNSNFDDQYTWIQVPGLGLHHEPEIGSPEMPYNTPPIPRPPEAPVCEPSIKWNGPSELLLDPLDVTGLLFNVKGISAHGSVIIRQDSHFKGQDVINITNIIHLSDDSLQKQVDIVIDIIDDDYSITIETPSFNGRECVKVDTIITIPSNFNYFRSLLVDAPNSWISAEGLGAIDFAYVSLKSRNGHIHANDISAGIAEIATVNGHVRGGYIVAQSLDVRTVNGAVGIDAVIHPLADEVSISTKSMNGHIDISVHELNEKQALDLKAASVNGGIIAYLPDAFNGDFSASTLMGYSYVEGQDITYVKKTQKVKIGHKGKDDDDSKKKTKKCHHGHKSRLDDKKKSKSQIVAEAVTGAIELYFL